MFPRVSLKWKVNHWCVSTLKIYGLIFNSITNLTTKFNSNTIKLKLVKTVLTSKTSIKMIFRSGKDWEWAISSLNLFFSALTCSKTNWLSRIRKCLLLGRWEEFRQIIILKQSLMEWMKHLNKSWSSNYQILTLARIKLWQSGLQHLYT